MADKYPLIPKERSVQRKNAIASVNIKRANARRTPERRRTNAVLAGLASGRARRQRQSFKEIIMTLCELPLSTENLIEMGYNQEFAEKLGGQVTNLMVATAALMQRAQDGDLQAYETMRDTAGEQPTQKSEVSNIGPPPALTVNFGDE